MIIIKNNEIKQTLLKNQYFSYFIIGKEFLITEKIEKKILFFFNKKQYFNIIKIQVCLNQDWEKIFLEYYQQNLFFLKKILVLDIQQEIYNKNIIINIQNILKFKRKKIILIFKFTKYNSKKILKFFVKNFNQYNYVLIPVNKIKKIEIKEWIIKKFNKINLNFKKKTINILLNYHKNNLLILSKFLENLKLIKQSNYLITHETILDIIENVSKFDILDWIRSLLYNKKIQALKILNYFKINKIDILHLIQNIQIMIFILIKNHTTNTYKKYQIKITKNSIEKKINYLIQKSNYKLNKNNIYNVINILTKIEINFKIHQNELIWINLKTLIMIL